MIEFNKRHFMKKIGRNKADALRGKTMMENRYYVQPLTEQVFLVRERLTQDGNPGPDDRIVKSFNFHHDASMYAESMNEKQRDLDNHTDHEVRRTI
jgi:hypothetical protein